MIQLFLKTTRIEKADWDNSYKRILKIAYQFPLKLQRIESYNGFSKNIDKIHYDLIVNQGEKNEHISFWSDQMSFTAGYTIKFYKNWEVQKKNMVGSEKDTTKPVTWYPPKIFDFSGYNPGANGAKLDSDYLDTAAIYRYAILAIGIMLENTLPGRSFLVAFRTTNKEINHIRKWLEYIFNESFDMPIFFDKLRLLESIKEHYDNQMDVVGRLDTLYKKQFKNNMVFALQQIGYKPTLEYYAHVLSHANWGTFGFSDIFLPWIASTKDLGKSLELLTRSKQILLSDKEDKYKIEQATKYNYVEILKELLKQYILWTPEQRQFLDKFYTNKKALETGHEGLFGSIMRIGGMRVDICPIYASPEYLFESFMYHDPKNGKEYKKIINNWIEISQTKYDELIQHFSEIENSLQSTVDKDSETVQKQESEELKFTERINKFTQNYAEPERFFVIEALKMNPYYLDKEKVVDELQIEMYQLCKKNIKDIKYQYEKSKKEKLNILNHWIKEKQLSVSPEFSDWLNEETDEGVLTSLAILVSLRLYKNKQSYARYQILVNKKYWQIWKKGKKYSLIKLFDSIENQESNE